MGIGVHSLTSIDAAPALYYSDKEGVNKSLLLKSGKLMQVWIDYDEVEMFVNVTLAPIGHPRPSKNILSKHINLSSVLLVSMYAGFSSSAGFLSNSHYLLGWSWNQKWKASKLPSLPRFRNQRQRLNLTFLVLLIFVVLYFLVIVGAAWSVRRNKYEELCEPWEREYAPD